MEIKMNGMLQWIHWKSKKCDNKKWMRTGTQHPEWKKFEICKNQSISGACLCNFKSNQVLGIPFDTIKILPLFIRKQKDNDFPITGFRSTVWCGHFMLSQVQKYNTLVAISWILNAFEILAIVKDPKWEYHFYFEEFEWIKH